MTASVNEAMRTGGEDTLIVVDCAERFLSRRALAVPKGDEVVPINRQSLRSLTSFSSELRQRSTLCAMHKSR